MDSTEVNLGPEMEEELAGVMFQIWGQAKYTYQQKKEFEKIFIPKNAKFLITPLLDLEITRQVYNGPRVVKFIRNQKIIFNKK